MFSFLRKFFGFKNTKEKTTQPINTIETQNNDPPPMREVHMKKFLIAVLGNIGPKYENTRHNIGFKILDYLAKEEGLAWETEKLGAITRYKLKGRTFILLKPSTYMNLSGKAVKYWMEKEKVEKENILVVTDDLNFLQLAMHFLKGAK